MLVGMLTIKRVRFLQRCCLLFVVKLESSQVKSVNTLHKLCATICIFLKANVAQAIGGRVLAFKFSIKCNFLRDVLGVKSNFHIGNESLSLVFSIRIGHQNFTKDDELFTDVLGLPSLVSFRHFQKRSTSVTSIFSSIRLLLLNFIPHLTIHSIFKHIAAFHSFLT